MPVKQADGTVCAVLDIDSRELGAFDDTDRHYLEQVAAVVARQLQAASENGQR